MSINTSFAKIKREIGIKKCIIIDGNVGDVYLNEKGKILNIKEALDAILKELQYDDVIYWDRVDGAKGNLQNLQIIEETIVEGDQYLDEEEKTTPEPKIGLFKQPAEIFNIVLKNLTNPKKKMAFVLNWAEYLFDGGGQQIAGEGLDNITILGKALKDKKIDYFNTDVNESTIIFITNKISLFPISFYQGNPEVSSITLTKPDRLEREKMMEKIEDSFNVRVPGNVSLMSSEKKAEYVDMLDDFTNREIIQISKLSRKEDKMTFDKLFYLFKYGEKENPWEKLDYNEVKNIKKRLSERVVGQDEAIEKVEKTIVKAYMGLTGIHKSSSRSMPKGIFFFVGPTGVGKTELSKALAKFLFGDEQACIRFDMSEYATENSDQKLIGAAPGYVGYEEGGQLTNAVKEKPFSVILFDEIEKAAKPNPRILDIFLQILEDGRLTDSKGETVYFSDTIIIFTSNLGASQVQLSDDHEDVAKQFIRIVKEYFDVEIKRPEILGRIGYSNIVPFNFIMNKEFVIKIAKSKLKPIKAGIYEKYRIDLEFEDEMKFVNYISTKVDSSKGGRDILNAINDHLLEPLAMFMFSNKNDLSSFKGGKIVVKLKGSGLDFGFDTN
jgi:energy-coupling factor transporter ATP-binding protein EcfA2